MRPSATRRAVRSAAGALTAVAALAVGLVLGPAPAAAAQPGPEPAADFYQPPSPLPDGANGDLIRSEPSEFFLDPLKVLPAPATVTRIMYRSTDTADRPIAVTGTVLTPRGPWIGRGERPIIGYAVGTQGIGDQCAPSRQLAAGTEYEGAFLSGLLVRGYGVVVTDYEGLGTPGVHTYTNRASQAHAVLDSVRAAQRLEGSGLPGDGPILLSGYSQGGGASAAAAELASAYAPELDLLGAYAGAVPADLAAVAGPLDGGLYSGFLLYALNGLDAAYPELDFAAVLNDRGDQILAESAQQCVVETIARYPFTRSADLTEDGRPLTDYLDEEPYASRVAEQQIGLRTPEAPVLVVHSLLDDIVPYEQDRTMARSWCEQGATVRFSTQLTPTHVGAAVTAFPEAFAFLEARVAGLPPLNTCGLF